MRCGCCRAVRATGAFAFCNGLGTGYHGVGHGAAVVGFFLAAVLPTLLGGGVLFLTPMSFLVSTRATPRSSTGWRSRFGSCWRRCWRYAMSTRPAVDRLAPGRSPMRSHRMRRRRDEMRV